MGATSGPHIFAIPNGVGIGTGTGLILFVGSRMQAFGQVWLTTGVTDMTQDKFPTSRDSAKLLQNGMEIEMGKHLCYYFQLHSQLASVLLYPS